MKPQVRQLRFDPVGMTDPWRKDVPRFQESSEGLRSLGFAPNDTAGDERFRRNWFEGSQVSKARPGAPFDLPFDGAEGSSFVISLPTRFSESACSDTKERATFVLKAFLDRQWRQWRRLMLDRY